jgi:hypothetical protein
MASEKKTIGSFTVKVGLVLLVGCILLPMSLVTMFRHYAVPMRTCKFFALILTPQSYCTSSSNGIDCSSLIVVVAVSLVFSVDSASSATLEGRRIGPDRSGMVSIVRFTRRNRNSEKSRASCSQFTSSRFIHETFRVHDSFMLEPQPLAMKWKKFEQCQSDDRFW